MLGSNESVVSLQPMGGLQLKLLQAGFASKSAVLPASLFLL